MEDILKGAESRMQQALEVMANEFRGVRTGRANPALVENLKVDYYGNPTPLKQLAAITTPDPRTLILKPFDVGILGNIEKAIQASDLGLNPQNDGKMIRLSIPPLSEDRRRQMAERAKKIAETAKVHIRNVRRDAKNAIDQRFKEKKIGEDQKFRATDDLQKLLDRFEKKIDEATASKTKEIMEG